ncbi:MAG: hypothetical protein ACRYGP_10530 [Janthinobacterium lividum]
MISRPVSIATAGGVGHPPAGRSPYGADGEAKLFQDVSHRVQAAVRRMDGATSAGPAFNPWPALIGTALAGYVIGALIHKR